MRTARRCLANASASLHRVVEVNFVQSTVVPIQRDGGQITEMREASATGLCFQHVADPAEEVRCVCLGLDRRLNDDVQSEGLGGIRRRRSMPALRKSPWFGALACGR